MTRTRWIGPMALTAAAGLLLAGCGSTTSGATGSASSGTAAGGAVAGASVEGTSRDAGQTVPAATPRVALTYDGGLLVLDGQTLEVAADIPLAGFNRVNAAGDGRHVMVSTEGGFRVLDAGTWTADGAAKVAEPTLTDLTFAAQTPGHVVRHADRTVLFDDGTGEITAFDTDTLLTASSLPPTARSARSTPLTTSAGPATPT